MSNSLIQELNEAQSTDNDLHYLCHTAAERIVALEASQKELIESLENIVGLYIQLRTENIKDFAAAARQMTRDELIQAGRVLDKAKWLSRP